MSRVSFSTSMTAFGAVLACALSACAQPGSVVPTGSAPAPVAAPAAPASTPTGGPQEQKVAPELTITETTMADFAGLRLGVGNVWEAEFTGPDGKPTRGPTAMLSFAASDGADLHRERVHVGSHVTVSGRTFEIRNVNAPEKGLGSVTVAATPAPASSPSSQGKP